MQHRYGRHGPHAWLRWYHRKYPAKHSTSLVPVVRPPTTLMIQISPDKTERIIIIVATYSQDDDMYQSIESTGGLRQLHAGHEALINAAKKRAFHDSRVVNGLLKEEPLVEIRGPRVEKIIGEVVDAYLETVIEHGNLPSNDELERLTVIADKAYWEEFYQRVNKYQTRLISTEEEAKLRDAAVRDRKTYPTYASRDFHQRDLAVMRVILIMGISLDSDECLETLHTYADKYEKYFRTPPEEVAVWPEKSFRP